MKNPLTPAGIEPAFFQFVAQHLNPCATAVPDTNGGHKEYVLQNQNFVFSHHVYCGEWFGAGGTLTGVSLGTRNMASVLIAQCR